MVLMLLPATGLFQARAENIEAEITVDLGATSETTIKPYIYGGFVEFLGSVINHQYGLWAQEIDYRGFEAPDPGDTGFAKKWESITRGTNTSECLLDTARYNRRGSYSQRIDISSFTDGFSGIVQSPIIIKPGQTYDLCLHMKGSEIDSSVTVWLIDRPSEWVVIDSVTFCDIGDSWSKYSAAMTASTERYRGTFAITFCEEGTIWIDDVSLISQDAHNGVRTEYFELIETMNPGIMRYPGGCFADGDASHWEDGVGDVDQRPTNWDNHWGNYQRMDFGTDEFVQFCRDVDMEPQITVNFGSGSPTEAASWVEYANGDIATEYGGFRAQNGHPEPYNITFWEIGNEQYGDWEIGHTSATEYAARFRHFANSMKAVDPSIKVIANGAFSRAWTDTILTLAGDVMDYVSVHYCIPWNVSEYSDQEIYQAVVAAPLHFGALLEMLEQRIHSLTQENVRIAITEWWNDFYPLEHHNETLEVGLFVAGMLNLFQRETDILDLANRSTFVEILACMGNDEPFAFYATPAAHVLSLYSNYSGAVPVSCGVVCSTYSSPHVNEIPAMASVPFLDVSVTRKDERIYLNVVNRSLNDIETKIIMTGGEIESEAVVRTINGHDVLSNNHEPPHDNIVIEESPLSGISQTFLYTFPAHSVTGLELTAAESGTSLPLPESLTYSIGDAWPNPFCSSTMIAYTLPKETNVSLRIFDMLGQRVCTLVEEDQPAGPHIVAWHGNNAHGKPVASGIYLCRAEFGKEYRRTRRLSLLGNP